MSDINLYTKDTGGDGRPVILIHGWPLTGASWSHQVDALTDAGYRVITYDRRGFGQSDKPGNGYDYEAFANDLASIIDDKDLTDVTLVGFSMGGGEVARYAAKQGTTALHSVVFAAAVTPYMLHSDDNPEGPLDQASLDQFQESLQQDENAFYDQFTKDFFTANGKLSVSEDERQKAVNEAHQADKTAALEAMRAWATTDFRDAMASIDVPALIIHGDADALVPYSGSGKRTHESIKGSELCVIKGGPHGLNASHADEFNQALLDFLAK